MGKRINYEIGPLPSAILQSNSHHESEDPEEVFRALVRKNSVSQTGLVADLLQATYQSSCHGHKAGDCMFTIDLHAQDREKVLRVLYDQGRARIAEVTP